MYLGQSFFFLLFWQFILRTVNWRTPLLFLRSCEHRWSCWYSWWGCCWWSSCCYWSTVCCSWRRSWRRQRGRMVPFFSFRTVQIGGGILWTGGVDEGVIVGGLEEDGVDLENYGRRADFLVSSSRFLNSKSSSNFFRHGLTHLLLGGDTDVVFFVVLVLVHGGSKLSVPSRETFQNLEFASWTFLPSDTPPSTSRLFPRPFLVKEKYQREGDAGFFPTGSGYWCPGGNRDYGSLFFAFQGVSTGDNHWHPASFQVQPVGNWVEGLSIKHDVESPFSTHTVVRRRHGISKLQQVSS